MRKIDRRDFLKAAPASAGVAAMLGAGRTIAGTQNEAATKRDDVRMSGTAYTPVPDYPIRPQAYSEVKLEDAFWKPKIATNAAVTIPFQAQKLVDGGRGLAGNVLEAAILSLKTHPNPQLQAQVDASDPPMVCTTISSSTIRLFPAASEMPSTASSCIG